MMAPFFTGKGDDGTTGFLGEGRISKSSARIEALGSVDEATAAIGFARALSQLEDTKAILLKTQQQLYWLMAELAAAPENAERFRQLDEDHLQTLEAKIDQLERAVTVPREFILPGETPAAGALAIARTVVRRAERSTVRLSETGEMVRPLLVAYLNRLSSLLFILEVAESSEFGKGPKPAKVPVP